jgi:hypothetical protein
MKEVYKEKPFTKRQLNKMQRVKVLIDELRADGIRVEGQQWNLTFMNTQNYEFASSHGNGNPKLNFGEPISDYTIDIDDSGADDEFAYPGGIEIIRRGVK